MADRIGSNSREQLIQLEISCWADLLLFYVPACIMGEFQKNAHWEDLKIVKQIYTERLRF